MFLLPKVLNVVLVHSTCVPDNLLYKVYKADTYCCKQTCKLFSSGFVNV